MLRVAPIGSSAGADAASPGNVQAASPEVPKVNDPSFDALLRRAIKLSMGQRSQAGSREELASLLSELQPEARSKLQIVMTAGREGLSLRSAHASVSAVPADALVTSELETAGDELGDYLAAGYAIACASQFELDAAPEHWSAAESGDLEERVWLRFGKQLAVSPPEEWECLGAVGGGKERLDQLYLRLGKSTWWSFGAVIDRPSPETVRKSGRARSGPHSKLGPLRNVASRRCAPDRRALRRALRAIRARVGKPLDV